MARRSLFLLAAGLLTVVGCISPSEPPPPPPTTTPPRPTEICGQSFTGTSQYQSAFHNLGRADTGWVTADGFVPASLPDGRTAWWMSDSMTGTAEPDNSVPDHGNVHNTLVLQHGTCLTPKFAQPMIPETGSAWYWPGSTVIEGNTLAVFAYKVTHAPGPPGFDWKVLGTSVARFSLPSLQPVGELVDMPLLETPEDPYGGVMIPWGIRSFLNAADGKVYLYGTTRRPGSIPAADAWVARAPFADVTNQSGWEFFTGLPAPLDWSSDFSAAKPMAFNNGLLPDSSPIAQLSVVPYGNRYLAGAFAADVFKDENGRAPMRAWIADTPQGPWQPLGDVAMFEDRTTNQIGYDARIVDLPGPRWTVVYNVNDPIDQWDDFTLYRGEFSVPNAGVLPSP